MNQLNEYDSSFRSEQSIWIELETAGARTSFELLPDGDRAIAVGSDAHADVQLSKPGVLGVHLYIERDGNGARLVPAGTRDVRLDGNRLHGPTRILTSALIEFAGVRMNVGVLSERPASSPTDSDPSGGRAHRVAYVRTLPELTATTTFSPAVTEASIWADESQTVPLRPFAESKSCDARAAEPPSQYSPAEDPSDDLLTVPLRPVAPTECGSSVELQTAPMQPLAVGDPLAPQTTAPIQTFFPPFDPSETQDTVPVRPVVASEFVSPEVTERLVPVESVPIRPCPMKTVQGPAATSLLVVSPDATTGFEPVRTSAGSERRPLPAIDPNHVGGETRPEAQYAPLAPVNQERGPRRLLRRLQSSLAELGILTQRRPGRVAAVAVVLSFVLTSALVAASRAVHSRATNPPAPKIEHVASTPSAVAAALIASTPENGGPRPVPASSSRPDEPAISFATGPAGKTAPRNTPGAPVTDTEVSAAVNALVTGRRPDAAKAYVDLARRNPENPAYEALARLVTRSTDPRCATSEPPQSCPEVKK